MERTSPEIAGDVIDFALGEVWSGTTASVLIDVCLALTMITYNYAASRYVVTVTEAASIDAAVRRLAESRALEAARCSPIRRTLSRSVRRLNPLTLAEVPHDQSIHPATPK